MLLAEQISKPDTDSNDILDAVNTCVACGMCLPHCPTYRHTNLEVESPRGRIMLVKGLMEGKLQADDVMATHLDNCLQCRRCETCCPAGVRYGEIIEYGQSMMKQAGVVPQGRSMPILATLVSIAMRRRISIRLMASLVSLIQYSRADRLLARSGLPVLGHMSRVILRSPRFSLLPLLKSHHPAQSECKGRVALFVGCVSEQGEKDVLQAAIRVMNRLGYDVEIPRRQVCCGANDRHAGRNSEAQILERRNAEVFLQSGCDAIVSVSTGCGARLKAMDGVLTQEDRAGRQSPRLYDIVEFIASVEWPEHIGLTRSNEKVYVHHPCSGTFSGQSAQTVRRILDRIPGIDLLEYRQAGCCGASGMRSILENEEKHAHGVDLVHKIAEHDPDTVLSSNLTCRNHLQHRLGTKRIRFMHPVQFIDLHMTSDQRENP